MMPADQRVHQPEIHDRHRLSELRRERGHSTQRPIRVNVETLRGLLHLGGDVLAGSLVVVHPPAHHGARQALPVLRGVELHHVIHNSLL